MESFINQINDFHPWLLAGMFPDAFTHREHRHVPPTHRLVPFPANVGHAGFSCAQ